MTQYLLTIYQPDGPAPPPEFLEPVMRKVHDLVDEMKGRGVWVFSGGLHPPEASTVVQRRDDDLLLTDGPYVEGREHIGGFTIVLAPDLDAALAWARKLADAVAPLPIEVRPFAH